MNRSAGILLPISSLPSKYGIGNFGKKAYEFVDWLKEAGQTYWQILPLVPTSYGDSPYQSFSTYAGNPYFIDLDALVEEGVLTQEEVDAAATRLAKAIIAMGADIVPPQAVEDVAVVDAKVFPTKVTNFVTIEADNMVSVKIVSITGKVVAQEMAAGDEIEINTSMFAQGVYRVIIETENGTISEYLVNLVAKIGEKISFRRFEVVEKTDKDIFGCYSHMGGRISVLTVIEGANEEDMEENTSSDASAITE